MKISVSNIAWAQEEEASALALLKDFGISAIEVAPTKLWSTPLAVNEAEAKAVRDSYYKQGFEIPAMQSLLFGQPQFDLFGTEADRIAMMDYLKKIVRLGSWLGAKVLVFGSPKNRQRKSLSIEAASAIAVTFFKELGDFANSCGTSIGIEANAREYGCDFINRAVEAAEFVKSVKSDGFVLHLDLGNMMMEKEEIPVILDGLLDRAKHFHLSAPYLAPITADNWSISVHAIASMKRFQNFFSLETKCTSLADLENSLTVVYQNFGILK